jgi:hypothetical protein
MGGSAMFSKSVLSKVGLLLMLVLLLMNIIFGIPVLADGGGDQPFPPDRSPLPEGDTGGMSLLVTFITILQLAL